jgi:SAM-dependent methyltransferase
LTRFETLARNWDVLGETDPFYGVLSDPTKHGNQWNTDEFFASGRAHVAMLLRMLGDARASFTPGRCLDFGCGVGRLTLPLSELFDHTVGVDVAAPMIATALRHRPQQARCEFIVNRDPDLRRFPSATFDVVHSSLVLQHIPPEVSIEYVTEFFRVCRPGGLVMFQLPAEARTAEETLTSYALPSSACRAELAVLNLPAEIAASAYTTMQVRVTNHGDVVWRHDIPAGRHICVGNHWLHPDGSRAIDDDGRAFLPGPLAPGASVDIALTVQAPDQPGLYVLELDVVQEHIAWFSAQGSPTVRIAVPITGERAAVRPTLPAVSLAMPAVTPGGSGGAPSFLKRLLQRIRGAAPTFEMHVVPRAEVERVAQCSGGQVLRAVDDNAAGPGWLSYTYICRKC